MVNFHTKGGYGNGWLKINERKGWNGLVNHDLGEICRDLLNNSGIGDSVFFRARVFERKVKKKK